MLTVSGVLRDAYAGIGGPLPLAEVQYGQVKLESALHLRQLENVRSVLMGLSDDSLLMPFRKMMGETAPGEDIGGWYQFLPDFDYKGGNAGFAPASTFGQWVSALSRLYAATGDVELRAKVLRLNRLFGQTIGTPYFEQSRFPAYSFDKLVCGLMDAHRWAGDADAWQILAKTTDAATPELPGRAVAREVFWRPEKGALRADPSWTWDESYTLPENLYLVSAQMGATGAGRRYSQMAAQYLDDAAFFNPLAKGENVLGGKHAYSYVNALCSAMQAYMVDGSEKHLLAAKNGFDMLEQQSFATGGWGPDELLRRPGTDALYESLTKTHNTFETPCGSYAHMKLTRYLLRCTRDGRYGDSMERVMYNTVLGALPLKADGQSFYYADYNNVGQRVYSTHRWPCCSGTLPQVVADYGINAYFTDPGAVWVNLYMASTLRLNVGGAQVVIVQEGGYPDTEQVRLRFTSLSSREASFALNLRVPAWANDTRVLVNGKAVPVRVVRGFTTVHRSWRAGDLVEMDLPMRLRLEPLPANGGEAQADIAALLCGPRVLFALGPGPVSCTREQALAAVRISTAEWKINTAAGEMKMVPFTDVGDATYSTYLRIG